jgi:hypothetical protein
VPGTRPTPGDATHIFDGLVAQLVAHLSGRQKAPSSSLGRSTRCGGAKYAWADHPARGWSPRWSRQSTHYTTNDPVAQSGQSGGPLTRAAGVQIPSGSPGDAEGRPAGVVGAAGAAAGFRAPPRSHAASDRVGTYEVRIPHKHVHRARVVERRSEKPEVRGSTPRLDTCRRGSPRAGYPARRS